MPQSIQQRALTDFLRREYGVEHTKIEQRKRHAYLLWAYRDKHFRYMFSRGTGTIHSHTMMNAKADIRRMMGRPVDSIREEEETVEQIEIVREPEPKPAAKTWSVAVGSYRPGGPDSAPQVAFLFPKEIEEFLPTFTIEPLDSEHWRFRRGGMRTWNGYGKSRVRSTIADNKSSEPFAQVTVEAIEVDGDFLVAVPMAGRKRLPSSQPQPQPVRRPATVQAPPPPAPPPPVPAPVPPPQWVEGTHIEFRLRNVLQLARDLEKMCPYRLARHENILFWKAPNIE